MRGGMSVPWGGWVFQGDGSSRGDGCSRGMGVPGGWVFQGDGCSRGMSVLGDGCLGGWEFHNSLQSIRDVIEGRLELRIIKGWGLGATKAINIGDQRQHSSRGFMAGGKFWGYKLFHPAF